VGFNVGRYNVEKYIYCDSTAYFTIVDLHSPLLVKCNVLTSTICGSVHFSDIDPVNFSSTACTSFVCLLIHACNGCSMAIGQIINFITDCISVPFQDFC